MTKLTNYQRDRIASRAADSKYQTSNGRFLADEQDALAREIYNTLLPEKLREQLATLPRGWVERGNTVYFAMEGGRYDGLKLNAIYDDDPNLLPTKGFGGRDALGVISPELAARVTELKARMAAEEEAYDEVKRAVRQLLATCNTFEQLRKVWPEGLEFYRDYFEQPDKPLPMLEVEKVNEMLGLPRELQEAA